MCLAVEGKVLEVKDGKALIDYNGEKREAIAKDIKVKKGDEVLVQFGIVIQKINQKS